MSMERTPQTYGKELAQGGAGTNKMRAEFKENEFHFSKRS